jgi:thiol-disulfide isomerase/thioredoxin
MKRVYVFATLALILAATVGQGQNRSIRFSEKKWTEILAQAGAEKKLVFLDAYASWCGPCKWMAANMFTNDTIADFFNRSFVCASIDMEKGEGINLSKTYKIKAYPSLLFISPDGQVVHKRVGAPRKTQDYINMGLIAMNPDEGYAAYAKRYSNGETDPLFIRNYLQRLTEAYENPADVLTRYFQTQKDEDLFSRINWSIIYSFVGDPDSRAFVFLVKNQQKFGSLYSKDSVDSKISEVYTRALMQYSRNNSGANADYDALKQKVLNSGYPGAEKIVFTSDLNNCLSQHQTDKYLTLAAQNADKYYGNDYMMLNNTAKTVLQLTARVDSAKARTYLEKALSWADKSVSIKATCENYDTRAQILLRLGRRPEAIESENMAISLARKQNTPSVQYEETLKQMTKSAPGKN